MNKIILTHADVLKQLPDLADRVTAKTAALGRMPRVYPIPRGGVPVAYMLGGIMNIALVDVPEHADIFVDDLIDSGRTRMRYALQCPDVPFEALFDKQATDTSGRYTLPVHLQDTWLVFPWEGSEAGSAEDIPVRLLQFIGENPERGGLLETPKRFLKAWREYSRGYKEDAAEILKVFEDGAEKVDEMVLVKDIPVYSHCEHHLAPFFGVAHIAYIPNGRIVGLSKLSRLVDMFAKRLQVQERLTNQIADALEQHLQPLAAGVVIECRHMCMESRGIQRQGSSTVTSAMRGVLRTSPAARSELMDLISRRS